MQPEKLSNWTTYPNTAASLCHSWKSCCKLNALLYIPEELWNITVMPFKMVNNYNNHAVLQSKGTGVKVINCRLFCLQIAALQYSVCSPFKVCYFYIASREKKMDPCFKGGTSESKCWDKDLNVSKTFAHFCFQMSIFRHFGFHLNRGWPAASLSSLRIIVQELRKK